MNKEMNEEVEVMVEEKESVLKKFGAKVKSKLTVKNIVKTAVIGAGMVAAYALGAKSKSEDEDSCDYDVLDHEEVRAEIDGSIEE